MARQCSRCSPLPCLDLDRAFKKQVKSLYPAQARVWMSGGEMLARRENFVELDPVVKDKWGIPVLKIHCTHSDNDQALYQDFFNRAQELFHAAHGEASVTKPFLAPPGSLFHEVGTCRMGRRAEDQRLELFLPDTRCSKPVCFWRRLFCDNGR